MLRCSRLVCAALAVMGIPASPVGASEWGCQVILCLSNPGGPTQFDECRPPIEKLWKHLRKGRSFPTCSGSDFSVSKPNYDPYRCEGDLQLVQDDSGVMCRSAERTQESTNCGANTPEGFEGRHSTAQITVDGDNYACRDYAYAPAIPQEKPNYVDVRLSDGTTTRVRF